VEGINPGDVVANSSFEKLQANAKVNISKGSQAAPASRTKAPANGTKSTTNGTKATKSGNKATP
jgi:hypothetical protein